MIVCEISKFELSHVPSIASFLCRTDRELGRHWHISSWGPDPVIVDKILEFSCKRCFRILISVAVGKPAKTWKQISLYLMFRQYPRMLWMVGKIWGLAVTPKPLCRARCGWIDYFRGYHIKPTQALSQYVVCIIILGRPFLPENGMVQPMKLPGIGCYSLHAHFWPRSGIWKLFLQLTQCIVAGIRLHPVSGRTTDSDAFLPTVCDAPFYRSTFLSCTFIYSIFYEPNKTNFFTKHEFMRLCFLLCSWVWTSLYIHSVRILVTLSLQTMHCHRFGPSENSQWLHWNVWRKRDKWMGAAYRT